MIDCTEWNHDCKTSFGLSQDSLFNNWKFGFVFDPRLYQTFDFLYFSFSTVYFGSSWSTYTIVFATLNKPSLPNTPPPPPPAEP